MDKHETLHALAMAVEACGGLSKVAAALNVTTNRLANWLKRGVPAERCPDVEAATGVPCEKLRPDVNWHVLRQTSRKPRHRADSTTAERGAQ
ncbi:helix-turn-helix domain-containing protein [Cupriavidus gilardii]|uniref:helix-turn-helix domain-containing protein n=1 Tax=Cupriavidus gilardii TaxID=82541 RepID=UPI0021B281EE|nr:helix-turn-helix domain-containing protein [Cupriavidus gilardii]UXC37333.1 helix-turn-helix domain-containing protein [Cupriavidus gilardii]